MKGHFRQVPVRRFNEHMGTMNVFHGMITYTWVDEHGALVVLLGLGL